MKLVVSSFLLWCMVLQLQVNNVITKLPAKPGPERCPLNNAVKLPCPVNEEFICCGEPCQTKCDNMPCNIRLSKCPDACYCKSGYARNACGKCIPKRKCPKYDNE